MELLLKVLAGIRRVEEAIDDKSSDEVRRQLRELRKVMHEEYAKRQEEGRQAVTLEPTLPAVHDVPTIEDSPFERTHTATFIGRLRRATKKDNPIGVLVLMGLSMILHWAPLSVLQVLP